MHKINNLIVVQTNEQLQYKAESDATFQAVNTNQDPIGYLIILKSICFSKQYDQHPTRSLCLFKRRFYNTIQYANKNTTE